MDVLSSEQMLACEEEVFRTGLTAAGLMEAAGEAMTQRIVALYPDARIFVVLTGKGNNGGDGLVVARLLMKFGKRVQVVMTAADDELGDLPRSRLGLLRGAFPGIEVLSWREDFSFPGSSGVVIDALLGIQARGVLRGVAAEVVAKLNAARERNFFRTVALDFPTGLAGYEGYGVPDNRDGAVVADLTLAVGFAKEVLCRERLSAWVGRLEVVPWSQAGATLGRRQALVGEELAGLLPRRSAFAHKGDFGRLTLVAGSPGFSGAATLCAQAAQAMGTGLLSIVTRLDSVSMVAAQAPPEVMVSGWSGNGDLPTVIRRASAIVLGPGLGTDALAEEMLRDVLGVGCPVLIDADGLNVLSRNLHFAREAKGPMVVTPHVGEMSRLIGRKFTPDEREAVAREFSDTYGVTLVLKGTRTLITAPGQSFFINTTGNPGLSTGGSGDTLSGMLGALLAQELTPLDAARLGVWLHGHAADLVLAKRGCEEGMTPTMLSACLGAALVSLRAGAVPKPGLLERARASI